jgi:hypothetical protein
MAPGGDRDGDGKEKSESGSTGDGGGSEKSAKPSIGDGGGMAKAAKSRAGDSGGREKEPVSSTGEGPKHGSIECVVDGKEGGKEKAAGSNSSDGGSMANASRGRNEVTGRVSSGATGGMGDGRAGRPNDSPLEKCCSRAIPRYGLLLRLNPSIRV